MFFDEEENQMPIIKRHEGKKFLIDIRINSLKDNIYQTAKIDKLIRPKDFDMDDTFFGGNVYTVAKLKDKKHYLLVNKLHTTIGICVRTDELDTLSKTDLIEWAKVQNITLDNKTSKEDIINKLIA